MKEHNNRLERIFFYEGEKWTGKIKETDKEFVFAGM